MYWGDQIVEAIVKNYKEKIRGREKLTIRDEKTASGRILISAMRGAVIHGAIAELLDERKIPREFLWEINDTDAFRSIPKGLDEAVYKKYLGFPLYALPSPRENAKNFPEYYGNEFQEVMKYLGFAPTYYRTSDIYREGKFNDAIRTALENAEKIRGIYKRVSGSVKDEDWLPVMIRCEQCGKIGTTKAVSFDGEKVRYVCATDTVEWASGCGHEGDISPFNGNATLPWKVEWAAKFKVFSVDIEGGGKDLSTKGGARDVANQIARDVFKHKPPFDIPYEFFLFEGKKMSTSKGNAPAARDVMDVLPYHIFRLMFLGKSYKQAIEFNIQGDAIPILYDLHDKLAEKYFVDIEDDDTRLFTCIHSPGTKIEKRFLPRFSTVAFLVQMPHLDLKEEIEKLKESQLTEEDWKELSLRAEYAKRWLEKYAPAMYKFELQESLPEGVSLDTATREAFAKILQYIEVHEVLDGQELHTKLHEIRKETGVEPRLFFSTLYMAFLGKDHGPKAGWFLSVLSRELLIKRLQEVTT